jgi:hypothetical protein
MIFLVTFFLYVMALQKPLKTAIGFISLDYNQAVIALKVAEGGFLPPRLYVAKFATKSIPGAPGLFISGRKLTLAGSQSDGVWTVA